MAEFAEDPPTVAASTPKSGADQIENLLPIPPALAPEYDYLTLLQSLNLNDAAGCAILNSSATSPFRLPPALTQKKQLYDCRAYLTDSSGYEDWILLDDRGSKEWYTTSRREIDWVYGQIQYTREKLIGKRQEGTSVLVVEDRSRGLLEILGAAMDLDPTFSWRHYNEDLDSDRYISELARLRNEFFSLVATSKKGCSGTDEDRKPSIPSTYEDRSIHLRYGLDDISKEQTHVFWGSSCHISCYRFSANSCGLFCAGI